MDDTRAQRDTTKAAYQARERATKASQDLVAARQQQAVNKALQAQAVKADPATLARVEQLRAAGEHAKADYWLAKALRLNTKAGIRSMQALVRENLTAPARVDAPPTTKA